jgi:hypothetical protein
MPTSITLCPYGLNSMGIAVAARIITSTGTRSATLTAEWSPVRTKHSLTGRQYIRKCSGWRTIRASGRRTGR